MSAKLRRPPPYLYLGILLSLLFHGAVVMLSYLPSLARRLLPRLPIEMTILPPKPHKAPPLPNVVPPPPPSPPPASPAQVSDAGRKPVPRKPTGKPTPAKPQGPPKLTPMTGLGPSAIDRDAGVRVILRMPQLQKSPHRPALINLLAAFPDTHILAHGTKLASASALAELLVDEVQVLLIATPNPGDITATAFYGIYADRAKLQAVLAGRKPLPWDPRQLSAPGKGLMAFARPDLLGPGTYMPPPPAGAPPGQDPAPPPAIDPGWPEQLRTSLLVPGPALSAEVLNVNERVRLGGGLPTPTALRLAMSGDEKPAVKLRVELRTPAEAEQLAALVPQLKGRLSPYLFLFGLSGLLDELKLETHGAAIELLGQVPGRQLDLLLALVAQQLPPAAQFLPPPPPPPPPDAVDMGTPDAGAPAATP